MKSKNNYFSRLALNEASIRWGSKNARENTIASPQPGKQRLFYEATENVVIYGGAAGSAKSVGLLLALGKPDYLQDSQYWSVIFRRTYAQFTNPGALLDESYNIYPSTQGDCTRSPLEWRFPSGSKIAFRHLQYTKDIHGYQGSQFACLGFDELTHFEEEQFFYMLSRNRTASSVKPQCKATCNPDAGSWLAKFIDWAIAPDGYPIEGVENRVRYFARIDDRVFWADDPKELCDRFPDRVSPEFPPLSFRFIPATIHDNPVFLDTPNGKQYLAYLNNQNEVERKRLLLGNWRVKPDNGFVKKDWIQYYNADDLPSEFDRVLQSWDTASKDTKTSAYWGMVTVGVKGNLIWILDYHCEKYKVAEGSDVVVACARQWHPNLVLIEDKDSGQTLCQNLPKREDFPYNILPCNPGNLSKVQRFDAESDFFKYRRVLLPRYLDWAVNLKEMLVNYPDVLVLDVIDALSQVLKYIRLNPPMRSGSAEDF